MSQNDAVDLSKGIHIFSSDYCPYCISAKRLLASKNVQWNEFKVDGQYELREKMAQLAGKRSVPQIWIQGKHIGGCDDLYLLEDKGELDSLLAL